MHGRNGHTAQQERSGKECIYADSIPLANRLTNDPVMNSGFWGFFRQLSRLPVGPSRP